MYEEIASMLITFGVVTLMSIAIYGATWHCINCWKN